MVKEVYNALRAAGVEESLARRAAEAVLPRTELATKADVADLTARLALMMRRIIRAIVGTAIALAIVWIIVEVLFGR